MKAKVLLLEDERPIRSFIRVNLKKEGFEVVEASSGEEALELFDENRDISIAVLDVMLPGISGFEVCRRMRSMDDEVGIIMLTAKTQETDKIEGFETGADDYVTKPFSPAELIARIRALSKRVGARDGRCCESLNLGQFMLDKKKKKLFKSECEIEVTPTEFAIMQLFMENPQESMSKDEIMDRIWGKNYIGDVKIVSVNIRRLRSKIEKDPSNPEYIKTLWGHGYMWGGEN